MKNLQIFFISAILFGCSSNSNGNISDNSPDVDPPDVVQTDCPGWALVNYIIESQEDLDRFALLFPNCKTFYGNIIFNEVEDFNTTALNNIEYIEGSLTFDGIGGGSYDLSGFNNLKSVRVNLEFKNTTLTSLTTNFQTLESVGGDLKIYQNNELESIAGVTNLSLISGEFEIKDNLALLNLGDFPSLIQVAGGNMNFTRNDLLTSIGKFGSLTKINGEFRIDLDANNTLTEFSGFNALKSVQGILLGGMTEVNISGFNNIETIDGFLAFGLINEVTGFESLNHIEGELNLLATFFEDLRILDQLQTIGGNLDIRVNDNLTSLNGLEQLTSVGGDFNIYGNEALVNLVGSNNLSTLGGAINIERNFNLKTISGFNTIQSMKELLITETGSIESLTGFNNLINIDDNLIFNNTYTSGGIVFDGFYNLQTVGLSVNLIWSNELVTFEGFTNLISVGESFFFNESSGLTNLDNFSNLTNVGGTLAIENHTSLENLDGFINLQSTLKDLIIQDNDVITDISGVQNINSVLEFIIISNNPMLSECSIVTVCQHLNDGLNNTIEQNASGCNSETDIISNCE